MWPRWATTCTEAGNMITGTSCLVEVGHYLQAEAGHYVPVRLVGLRWATICRLRWAVIIRYILLGRDGPL